MMGELFSGSSIKLRHQPRKATQQQLHTATHSLVAADIRISLLSIQGNRLLPVAEIEQGQQLLSLKVRRR